MATLGRAFIEVHADTDPFARELRQQMRRLSTDLKEDTDRAGRNIGERLGLQARRGLREAVSRRRLNVDVDVDLSPASVAAAEAALDAATRDREVDVTVNRRRLLAGLGLAGRLIGNFVLATVRILGDFFNFGRQIGQIFGEAFGNLTRSLGSTGTAAVSTSAALVQLAAAVVALTFVITLLVGVLGTLLAILVILVNTAQLFLTVIPGLAAGAVFALAPLVLIFTNLGDAIKATTKDADTFAAAIEDFGDNTRSVLTSVRGLVQFFLGLREAMQEAFFAPINNAIEALDANLGPTFRDGFLQVASAAGELAANFISLFDHPQAIPFFNALFDLAELGFEEIGGAVLNLVEAFANLIDESIPNVRRGVDGIASVINGWADSINEFADDPNFQETLQGWEESFERLRNIGGEIVELVGNLIAGFEDDGIPVLERVESIFEGINEFLTSDDAEEFFDGLRFAAIIFLSVLQGIIVVLGFFISLLGIIEDLVTLNLTEGFQDLTDLLGGLSPLALILLDNFLSIEGTWNRILFIIQLVSGPVLGFLLSRVEDWGGLVDAVQETYRDIRERVRETTQRAIDFITRLLRILGIVGSVRGVATGIRDRFGNILGHVRNILSPIRSVRSAASSIATFASRVASRFSSARTFISRILSPIRGIRTAASSIATFAGRFRDALSTAWFFARQVAATIANIRFPSAGGFFGSIFGQEGGIITQPTNMIVGEAGPEVLIPLTRPTRARELLTMSGLANMIRGGDGATVSAPGGGSALSTLRIQFVSDGSAAGDAITELVRRSVRIRGGDVQQALGAS